MTLISPSPTPRLADLGRVHFIAIGGAGMSGIASALTEKGITVSGSDAQDSAVLAQLASRGVTVHVGHDPSHVAGADTVVVSSAIRADNVELVEAQRLGLPVLHRSVALASLMEDARVVSIAGTHGKTTTTAMCVAGLSHAGMDPSFVVGAAILAGGAGSHLGAHIGVDPVFVVEADESDGSFRQYPTSIAVVTGVEEDHLDNWGTRERYYQGFVEFASAAGVRVLVVDGDDQRGWRLGREVAARGTQVITYGQSVRCEVRITGVTTAGTTSQATLTGPDWSASLHLPMPGVHNIHNAAAAVCVGRVLGAEPSGVLAGLAAFEGTARRFQLVGVARGVTVVDDYAHHPTEMVATLGAARVACPDGRVIACFQPHLFSRTLAFADQFGVALGMGADETVVMDVYPAREDPIDGVSGELVARAVRAFGGSVRYVPRMGDVARILAQMARPGDLVLTIGAGSVTEVGPKVLAELGR